VRRLVFHGPHALSVEDAAPAPLGPGEVRVAPAAVGICGSDVHGYVGANQRRVPGMVMGHEAAGTVVEVGPGVEGLAVGDRVAINPAVTCGECDFCRSGLDHRCEHRRLIGCVLELPGAFAESVVVPAANAVPFPGTAPLEWGALVEPFAVGDHGVGRLEGPLPHGVLVLGGGPIGLGAALGARRRGIERVVVSEPVAHRRAIAEALGLATYDPTSDPEPEPFSAAAECVALPATLEAALALTRPGGEVAFVGLGEPVLPLPVERLVVGERALKGSFNYSREDFADTARWVASGEVDLAPVIEARVDLDGLVTAFRAYADGTTAAMKTLYEPAGT
jgi:threonine dehydrogenase-like Zn-dependent dehydrogenase